MLDVGRDDTDAVEALLAFWFGELEDGLCASARRKALFGGGDAFDAEIAERFGDLIEDALAGRLDHWSATARGRLALVLILDQFTRNVFRGTARAFAGDARALDVAREGVGRGDDALLPLEPRVFLYMPFEHSESIADQQTMCVLIRDLLAEQADDAPARGILEAYAGHAREHRALVERFGRFPHRNAALGRTPTDEERTWLSSGGRSFGQ